MVNERDGQLTRTSTILEQLRHARLVIVVGNARRWWYALTGNSPAGAKALAKQEDTNGRDFNVGRIA